MRRRHNDPDELETLIEDETGEDGQGKLNGADNYSVQRNSAKARALRAVIVAQIVQSAASHSGHRITFNSHRHSLAACRLWAQA